MNILSFDYLSARDEQLVHSKDRLHRDVLIRDYSKFRLHRDEFQSLISTLVIFSV